MKQQIAGKRAKAYGAQFEKLIETSCRHYANKGIAYIQKTPEPFRMIGKGRNGQVIGFYEKQAQPDFQGTLKNGKSIVFEAKHTNDTNIRFDRVGRVQSNELERHSQLGAECYIIISFSFEQFYLIDWKNWKRLKQTINKKSVNKKDLESYEIKLVNGRLEFL